MIPFQNINLFFSNYTTTGPYNIFADDIIRIIVQASCTWPCSETHKVLWRILHNYTMPIRNPMNYNIVHPTTYSNICKPWAFFYKLQNSRQIVILR